MRFDKARVAVVLLVSLVALVTGLGSGERGAAAQVDGGAAIVATPSPAAVAAPAAASPQAPDCVGLPDLLPYAPDTFEYPVVPNSIKNSGTASSYLYAGKPTYFDWWFANVGNCDVLGSFHVEVRLDDVEFIRYPYPYMWVGVNGFADWGDSSQTPGWHTISIVVDPDNVIAESNENNNTWSRDFYWEPVNNWWAEFYNNQNLEGDPVLVRDDPAIDFEWLADSPGPGVNADHFSVRWTRDVDFNQGVYRFHLSRDDGMRFFIDGQMILDRWIYGVEELSIVRNMNSGSHALKLEAMDINGFAVAKLNWEQCFSLMRIVDPSAGGNITVWPPPNCDDDLYADGTWVTLTANPTGNYTFSRWGGALSGTTNPQTLTMNNDKSVTANFRLPCYALTRAGSTGGSAPTANPPNSAGCPADQYAAGEPITLSAWPNNGYRVKNWNGTDNDSSTSTTNTVTMPARDHTVGVTYEAIPPTCYKLTRTGSTGGNAPTSNPPNSTGCPNDQYTAGQSITLTAAPAAGRRVKNWSGTANDASTSTTNTVTMPDRDHTVGVTYEVIPPTTSRFFVPLAIHHPLGCFLGPGEQEPNNDWTQPNGPLCASGNYTGLPDDDRDYFMFETTTAGRIHITVSDFELARGLQLSLYYQTTTNTVVFDTDALDGLEVTVANAQPGRYFIRVFSAAPDPFGTRPYRMQVAFP